MRRSPYTTESIRTLVKRLKLEGGGPEAQARLQTAASFLLDRLFAMSGAEQPERELFARPSRWDEARLASKAREARASVISRVSSDLRPVLLKAEPMGEKGVGARWAGTYAATFAAQRAAFVWHGDVYRPRSLQDTTPGIAKVLGALQARFSRASACQGLMTTWGMIARGVPPRRYFETGGITPEGRGIRHVAWAAQDRPYVPRSVATFLTAFFVDEPMIQAYTRNAWYIVAPQRLFVWQRTWGASISANWLHAPDEAERLARWEHYNATRGKQTPAKGDKKRRRRNPSSNVAPNTSGQSVRRRQTKPFSLQDLYDVLQGILRDRR